MKSIGNLIQKKYKSVSHLKWHTIGVSVYSYIVVYTGALVRHTNSELVCLDWPFCKNDAIGLPTHFNEWVQMGHRFAAGLIFLWILYIAIHAIRNYKNQRVFLLGLDYRTNSRFITSNYRHDSCPNPIKPLSCIASFIIYHFIVRVAFVHDLTCIKKSKQKNTLLIDIGDD